MQRVMITAHVRRKNPALMNAGCGVIEWGKYFNKRGFSEVPSLMY
jgi:hypothetical protein